MAPTCVACQFPRHSSSEPTAVSWCGSSLLKTVGGPRAKGAAFLGIGGRPRLRRWGACRTSPGWPCPRLPQSGPLSCIDAHFSAPHVLANAGAVSLMSDLRRRSPRARANEMAGTGPESHVMRGAITLEAENPALGAGCCHAQIQPPSVWSPASPYSSGLKINGFKTAMRRRWRAHARRERPASRRATVRWRMPLHYRLLLPTAGRGRRHI
jgi:hypothetical protein